MCNNYNCVEVIQLSTVIVSCLLVTSSDVVICDLLLHWSLWTALMMMAEMNWLHLIKKRVHCQNAYRIFHCFLNSVQCCFASVWKYWSVRCIMHAPSAPSPKATQGIFWNVKTCEVTQRGRLWRNVSTSQNCTKFLSCVLHATFLSVTEPINKIVVMLKHRYNIH